MIVSAIVAVSENGVIGRGDQIPWRLSGDLRFFKRTTLYHHILMGRRSFESIGRPLPKRHNCIVSRNPLYTAPASCLLYRDIEEALHHIHQRGETEAFIIGGGEIYRPSMPLWGRLYLTRVHAGVEGDVFFPQPDWSAWQLISSERHEADEKNEYAYTFERYERAQPDRLPFGK